MLYKSNNFFFMGIINQTIECLDRNFEKHRAYESILNFCLALMKVLNLKSFYSFCGSSFYSRNLKSFLFEGE